MATNWAEDVKKYDPSADDGIIAGIVRYCGIALQKRDSSLVSFGDVKETDRVRQNFLKKKLAVEEPDSVLDAAIAAVGERMKGENFKNRVTVYYLLAQHFGKLSLFQKAPAKRATSNGSAALAAGAGAGAMGLASLDGGAAGSDDNAEPAPAADDSLSGKAAAGIAALGAVGAGAAAAVGSAGKTVTDAAGDAADAVADSTNDAVSGARNLAHDAADRAAELAHDAAAGATVAGAAVAGAAGAAAAGVAGMFAGDDAHRSSTSAAASSHYSEADGSSGGLGWLWWLLAALLLAGLVWWLFLRGPAADNGTAAADTASAAAVAPSASTGDAPAAGTVFANAPTEGTIEIPAGAGVTSELREGKPVVKVYFDTASAAVVPAFGDAAGGLKAWLAANPGTSLAVSGYNDSTGNAAANAELSKNRAFAVRDALIASGIAESSVETVKPEATTAGAGDDAAARRVEVVVR